MQQCLFNIPVPNAPERCYLFLVVSKHTVFWNVMLYTLLVLFPTVTMFVICLFDYAVRMNGKLEEGTESKLKKDNRIYACNVTVGNIVIV